ncbi:ABC transporter permease [Kribbella deserti]|uniref:ABC transporter permease n=1 Tax=Kribbella deserti TaxID=1926257 RepID=A0ABV6QMJ5_9ACTN
MFKLGLRTVLSHRLRFALSLTAVVLGVAFVAGSLIFADTFSTAIRRNFAATTADVVVTPVSGLGGSAANLGDNNAKPPTLTADLATQIQNLPGVAATDPSLLLGGLQLLDKAGKPIDTYGVPTFGASWPRYAETATFQLVSGAPPWGNQQIALDSRTAKRTGYEVGDQVRVVTPTGTITARISGTITPGTSGLAAGAPLIAFDGASAQLLLLGEQGWTSIGVALKPDQDRDAVIQRIRELGGPGVHVRTGAQVTEDSETALDQAFGGMSAVLLLFAAIALFVSSFLIVNTFSMLVAQRSRELALLRAIGASRRQVTRTVLAEAIVIGLIGSTLGLLFGAGVAGVLQATFAELDLDVPTGSLQIGPGTIITSYVVGIGVTCAAAWPAARRAGRMSPVAAMRQEIALPPKAARTRVVFGLLLIGMAAVSYTSTIAARGLPAAVLIGLGGAMGLTGVVLAGPLIGRYAVQLLTLPFGRSTPALLGARNAQRNPRRTAATASALMISLALVSGLGVLAASAEASVDQGVREAIGTSDVLVSGDEGAPMSGKVAGIVAAVDGVAGVGRARAMTGQVDGQQIRVTGVDPAVLNGPIVTKVEQGSLDGLAGGSVVVTRPLARQFSLTPGKTITVVTESGRHNLKVATVIAANRQLNGVVVSLDTFGRIGGAGTDSVLYVDLDEGVTMEQVQQPLLQALADYPSVQVRDQVAYAEAERGPIDLMRNVVLMLLALAILIAVLGIVNTLALSVVERTREIGLLRAVGMERGQLRRMVQIESVTIALLGALLGAGLGVLFGSAIQTVMSEDGMAVRDIPELQILASVLIAAVVGVLAAAWPARRAARLDVLRAIGTE